MIDKQARENIVKSAIKLTGIERTLLEARTVILPTLANPTKMTGVAQKLGKYSDLFLRLVKAPPDVRAVAKSEFAKLGPMLTSGGTPGLTIPPKRSMSFREKLRFRKSEEYLNPALISKYKEDTKFPMIGLDREPSTPKGKLLKEHEFQHGGQFLRHPVLMRLPIPGKKYAIEYWAQKGALKEMTPLEIKELKKGPITDTSPLAQAAAHQSTLKKLLGMKALIDAIE